MAKMMTIEELDEQITNLQKEREELKKEEKAKLENAKNERKAEVDKAFKKYIELRNAFVKDYGYYRITANENEELNKPWSDFFFF